MKASIFTHCRKKSVIKDDMAQLCWYGHWENMKENYGISFMCKKYVSHVTETYVKLNSKYSQIDIWGDFNLQLNIRWWCFVRATQQGTIF